MNRFRLNKNFIGLLSYGDLLQTIATGEGSSGFLWGPMVY